MIKGKQNKRNESTYNFYYLYNWVFFFLNNKHRGRIEVCGETYFNNFPREIAKTGRKLDVNISIPESLPLSTSHPSPASQIYYPVT